MGRRRRRIREFSSILNLSRREIRRIHRHLVVQCLVEEILSWMEEITKKNGRKGRK